MDYNPDDHDNSGYGGKNQAGKKQQKIGISSTFCTVKAAEWLPEIPTGKHSHPGGESHHVHSKNPGITGKQPENSETNPQQNIILSQSRGPHSWFKHV